MTLRDELIRWGAITPQPEVTPTRVPVEVSRLRLDDAALRAIRTGRPFIIEPFLAELDRRRRR